MTDYGTITLYGARERAHAIATIRVAPDLARVTIDEPRRSDDQSAKMHAMLGDIAKQKRWHGTVLHKDDWKQIFLAGLHKELRMVPNLDGDGFLTLAYSSRKLGWRQMSDLIELIAAWGAREGVIWSEPKRALEAA